MWLLDRFDIGYEVYRTTLEVIRMIVFRKCDIKCYFITDLRSDELLLKSWDE